MAVLGLKKKNNFILKLLSLFSVVRGYNIMALITAQYLASFFIFSPEKSLSYVFGDIQLHFIVLATIFVVAAGYIINDFYDTASDKINRPHKYIFDAKVSQSTKLSVYFTLNFCAFISAFFVSWRAALFFSAYIFLIWFYSHRVKKTLPFLRVLLATSLTIFPFFAIFVYYKNYSTIIVLLALYLFVLLAIREMIKEFQKVGGDVVQNYTSVFIRYGTSKAKKITALLTVIALLLIVLISLNYAEIGSMKYYFYLCFGFLAIFLSLLPKLQSKKQFTFAHNFLKFLILGGVFSLPFIDFPMLISKIKLIFY